MRGNVKGLLNVDGIITREIRVLQNLGKLGGRPIKCQG